MKDAPELNHGDARAMLCFETLTFAPIDRRMIDLTLLDAQETDWLNAYHAEVLEKVAPLCRSTTADWLKQACAPM